MKKLISQIKPLKKLTLPLVCLLSFLSANFSLAQSVNSGLPKEKQTTLGLYVTANEAYNKWKAAPGRVKILDVRTPEEYIFVGHAPMAWNIPAFLQTYQWDPEKQYYAMKPNPDFMAQVSLAFQPSDTILVMCRSGGRSAMAVNQMTNNGFMYVFNITDGMEGDPVNDPESAFIGQRLKNGWKNSGAPWTYDIDPKLMLIPNAK